MWLQFSKESKLRLKEHCLNFGRVLLRRSDDSAGPDATSTIGQITGLVANTQEVVPQVESETALIPRIPEVPETLSDDKLSAQTEEHPIDFGERYSVLEKLGQGGSAAVYKVQDKELGKAFAIKVMHPELIADENARRRFKQEAEAASCLTHHNLVAVYGNGLSADKAPYLVMDCLDGETLAQVLSREKYIKPARAIDIMIQCCDALIHMHMKGILHRDIKPSNIFVIKAGNGADIVKIVDFGIARFNFGETNTRLTQTSELLGSPLYMSPEQCTGNQLDFRSDIYSLGCVMYEMLTGVPPFQASNPVKIILNHVKGSVPSFRETAPGRNIAGELEQIVMRCLQKDPKDRYQMVDELLRDLITFRDTGNVKLTIVPQIARPKIWKRLAASLLDGLILSLGFSFMVFGASAALHIPCHPAIVAMAGGTGKFDLSMIFAVTTIVLTTWLILVPFAGPALAATYALFFPLMPAANVDIGADAGAFWTFALVFLPPLLSCIYYVTFETSKYRATPGKMLLGLVVVDESGKQLSLLKALMRYLAKALTVRLFFTEHRLECIRKPGEAIHKMLLRILRWDSYLIRNPSFDHWTQTYIVNRDALNNVFLPKLHEILKEENLKLGQIAWQHRSNRVGLIPPALVAFLLIGFLGIASLTKTVVTIPSMYACLNLMAVTLTLFWLAIQCFGPSVLLKTYSLGLTRSKRKLLTERNGQQRPNAMDKVLADGASSSGES